jgi:sRNA-binding regulator protein Hfq
MEVDVAQLRRESRSVKQLFTRVFGRRQSYYRLYLHFKRRRQMVFRGAVSSFSQARAVRRKCL